MENFIKRYEKKYGYIPTIIELYQHYTQGILVLTDGEECVLLQEFEKLNLC